jgi:hypothetical protein
MKSAVLVWIAPLLFLTAALSCGYSPAPKSGALKCGKDAEKRCPTGYHCAGDNACWRNGEDPLGVTGASLDGAGPSDGMGDAGENGSGNPGVDAAGGTIDGMAIGSPDAGFDDADGSRGSADGTTSREAGEPDLADIPDVPSGLPDSSEQCACPSDNNPCTEDVCVGGACVHRSVVVETPCAGGLCAGSVCCAGCISNGTCQLGNAVTACGGAGTPCQVCDDGNSCTRDRCSGARCFADPLSTGTCPGGVCSEGMCRCGHEGEPCCGTGPACVTPLGCEFGTCGKCGGQGEPCCNGSTCTSDGDACNGREVCVAGQCGRADPVTCSAPDDCHDPGKCNAATGLCSPPSPKVNGTGCNDGNACTLTDTCQGGVCTGANPKLCPAAGVCYDPGICSMQSGQCIPVAKSGGSCDDGDACTAIDTCSSGVCSGTPIACDSPSPRVCVSATALRTFIAPGTCSGGSCNYGFSDYNCVGSPGQQTCSSGACVGRWLNTSLNGAPEPRSNHTAIWTGSTMIIWGGAAPLADQYSNGAAYTPSSDSWTPIPSGAAIGKRWLHSAVWTGNEMIVWGGQAGTNTGGRFNTTTQLWTPTPVFGAPSGRNSHTAVWTGKEMIVWGGRVNINPGMAKGDGGRFDPSTNLWNTMSSMNAPSPRWDHTTIWTGTEMIVWGGAATNSATSYVGDGARYNPSTDTWTPLPSAKAPTPRATHAAVWTGREMIVWGGNNPAGPALDGARYDPATDRWTTISSTNAPNTGPVSVSAWTGEEFVVWSGTTGAGGRYVANADRWISLQTASSPSIPRSSSNSVWTGTELIVWGGVDPNPSGFVLLGTGSRYQQ